jgi:hypothetical protein
MFLAMGRPKNFTREVVLEPQSNPFNIVSPQKRGADYHGQRMQHY